MKAKSATTKRINIVRNAPGTLIWQRNYYEHTVRNELSLQRLRQYIHNNPLSWQEDQLHASRLSIKMVEAHGRGRFSK